MRAVIWTSAPHETEGYYVELLGKHNIVEFCVWRPTIQECKDWALENGATRIEEQ